MPIELRSISLLITLCMLANHASAYVDMFLDAKETSILMGVSNSLFYVFNGELRQNSVNHHLDIPAEKNRLKFNWKTGDVVNYKFSVVDLNNVARRHRMSINSVGFVPTRLSEFWINFNCSAASKDSLEPGSIDIEFRVFFELNSTMLTGFQKLISMPALNFTIKYHKICTKEEEEYTKQRVRSQRAGSNYLIAYLIIGALGGFSLFIAFVGFAMFIHGKVQAKKLLTKYESLHSKLTHEQQILKQQQQQLINEKLKNKVYKKQAGEHKKSNPYAKRTRPMNQLPNSNNESESLARNRDTANESNIYESVPDASVNNPNTATDIYQQRNVLPSVDESKHETADPNKTNMSQLNSSRARPEARRIKKEKIMLNLTTNTLHSVYNTSMSTNNLMPAYSNKRAYVDQCVRLERDKIDLGSLIVEGTFGQIFKGKLTTEKVETPIDDDSGPPITKLEVTPVYIKMPKESATEEQTDTMLKDCVAFRALKHKNLSPIIGICYQENHKPFTVFTACELGNLKHYLTELRNTKLKNNDFLMQLTNQTSFSEHPLISTQELLFIMLQMFKALNYLHGKQILHRDVATRNCWLDTNLSLKLADNGLSRDLFPDDYHCLANNENNPVAWMALETLQDNVMNFQAEVWSCGVFLWECFSLSAQPYENIDPMELTEWLGASSENRLAKPSNCPNELYDLYKKSWDADPASRPTLKEMFYALHKFYSNLDNYV